MSSAEDPTAGGDPAVESTDDVLDDVLLEAAAVAEGGFDDGVPMRTGSSIPPRWPRSATSTATRCCASKPSSTTIASGRHGRRPRVRERVASALVDKLLVVLDACDAAIGHGAADVEPIAKILLELLERDGLERMTPEGSPFDPEQPRGRAARARRGRRVRRRRGAAHGVRLEGPGPAPGHGEGQGLTMAAAAGVVREGLLQGPRCLGDGDGQGDHAGVPEARS